MVYHKRLGSKPKTPDTAVTKLIQDYGLSSYYYQKMGIMNAGTLLSGAKRNVKRLALSYFIRLSKPLHMKWYVVAEKLLRLQKEYPPKYDYYKEHKKRHTNNIEKRKPESR